MKKLKLFGSPNPIKKWGRIIRLTLFLLTCFFFTVNAGINSGGSLVILPENEGSGTAGEFSQQATKTVTGKVTDQNGEPLPGVNIVVKGTTTGTVTDANGNFSLSMPADANVLQFSFVGMTMLEVVLDGRTSLAVVMEESTIGLDEVVAIGYGELSRARLTTSISKLDTKVLDNAVFSNVGKALQGTIPGLRVINTTGQPGTSPSILLRGGASITSPGSPLVLVDGIVRAINDINSNDIESIDVLKDAASTAIYGARANNGVILITTKKGKTGVSNFEYTFRGGINQLPDDYELVSAREYYSYQRGGMQRTNNAWVQGNTKPVAGTITWTPSMYSQGIIDNNLRPKFDSLVGAGWEWMIDPFNNKDTLVFKDYTGQIGEEAFNQNAATQEHNVFFSGGNDRGQYVSSLNYYNEEGLAKNTMYERFSGSLNAAYKLRDNFDIDAGLTYSSSNTNSALTNDNFYRARMMYPYLRPTLDDGTPNPGVNASYGNAAYYEDKYVRLNRVSRTTLNTGVSWEIIPLLFLKANGSVYFTGNEVENFNKKLVYPTGTVDASRTASASFSRGTQQQHNVTAEYSKAIDKHSATILVGGEYFDTKSFALSAAGRGAPTDDIYTLNSAVERTSISSTKSEYRMLSGFGRLNYDYDSRYLFTAVMRYDGTSALKENRWGAFPGMSAGWNIHNEQFFKSSSLSQHISALKPRVSYGVNGNIAGIGTYEVQGVYAITTNYDAESSYLNTSIINSKLRWEKSTSLDAGVEAGLWNNRLFLNLNFYRRVTSDLLANLSLPRYTGFSSFRTNLGSLENKGFEFEVIAQILNLPNGLKWDLGFNAAYVKNKILELPYNGVENNRQGGWQIYDPSSGKLIWVGGYQEGERFGDIVAFKTERILRDWDDVWATVPNLYDAIAQLYGPEIYGSMPQNQRTGKYPIEPGDCLFKDFDNNDTIDSRDRYVVGNIYPTWTGGFTTTLSYKNFSLYGRFDYAAGHIIYNDFVAKNLGNMVGTMHKLTLVRDTWTPENPDAKYPVHLYADYPKLNIKRSGLHYSTPENHNSLFYEKGDYLAIREITLSYNIPQTLMSKIGIESAQLNLTGQNLAYITREYTGWNPEEGGSDVGRYPLPRNFLIGLKVLFF